MPWYSTPKSKKMRPRAPNGDVQSNFWHSHMAAGGCHRQHGGTPSRCQRHVRRREGGLEVCASTMPWYSTPKPKRMRPRAPNGGLQRNFWHTHMAAGDCHRQHGGTSSRPQRHDRRLRGGLEAYSSPMLWYCTPKPKRMRPRAPNGGLQCIICSISRKI
jgi:hypothetical protein